MREGTATLATTGQPSSPPAGTPAPAGGWALGWTGFGSERTCGRMCLEASISKTSPQVSGGDQVGSQATGSWRVGESAAGQLRCLRTADGGAALGRLPRRWQSPESHGARGPQGSGGGADGGVTQAGAVDSGRPLPPDAPQHPYLGPPAARGRRAAAAAAGPGATGRRAPWAAGGQRRGARLSAPGSAGSKLRPSLRSQRWAPAARFNYPAQEEGAGRARRGRGRGSPPPLPPAAPRWGPPGPLPPGGPSLLAPILEGRAGPRPGRGQGPQTSPRWGGPGQGGTRSAGSTPTPPPPTHPPPLASETRSPPHPSARVAGWVSKVSSARLLQKRGWGEPCLRQRGVPRIRGAF